MNFAANNSWLEWLLLASLALSAEPGAGQNAVLLRAVSVPRETIRLSDLLSPGASSQMQQAGEQIELGRTPQCHAVRVLEPADIKKQISSSSVLLGLTLSGPVLVQRTCFPIRREAVQRAISEFMQNQKIAADVVDSTLTWSETIYALRENPALRAEQALPDPARRVLQIRLRCEERTMCPSFWVAVSTKQPPHPLSTTAPPVESTQSPVLVRVGQRVMLIFEDPPLRMQLLVTCLQSGSLGKQVRAMDSSTHRVFQAEVTGAGTLMAHL
jgi:hypothetical protein